ncbi:MAG: hypothetical protein JWL67_1850 [Solirubrobacterales bacterium]|nr:hypothetical protein [Solirubrobacterales bacterium]
MSYSSSQLVARRGRRSALALTAVLAAVGALTVVSQAGAAGLPTVTVSVTSSSISVSGALQSGGVNVVSTATGVKESGVVLVALKPGATPEELFAFIGSKGGQDLNNVSKYGSIVFSTEVAPSHPSEVQIALQPGQYVALATQEEGPPRARAVFSVSASKAPVALPAAQATVRAIDFAFKGPSVLKVGELVRFENEGFLVHMDIAIPVKNKKAATKLVKYLRTGNEKAAGRLSAGPPVEFTGAVSNGASQQEVITAKPGWYVQACFMDTQDRHSHTLLGMERVMKITK